MIFLCTSKESHGYKKPKLVKQSHLLPGWLISPAGRGKQGMRFILASVGQLWSCTCKIGRHGWLKLV